MGRRIGWGWAAGVAGVAAVALLLGGCAVRPPVQQPAPTPTPVATPTPAPTFSPTSTSTALAPPPVVGTAAVLRLGPTSLGEFAFGTAEADVVADLLRRFGEPDKIDEGVFCAVNPQSTYEATRTYGGLSVYFAAKDRKASSPRKLSGWAYSLTNGMDPAFEVDDLPAADPTFAQLADRHPDGKLDDYTDIFGTKVFTLPNGMWFVGETEPDAVGAGPLLACE